MALPAQRTLIANGFEFAFVEEGDGEPVVFVHGSLLDYRYWQREVAQLGRHYRAIALSRRHHWPSVPDGPFVYRPSDHVDDLAAFVEALGCGPVHLVGHSYGGFLAARIGCERPDLLRSLVLMEPGGAIDGQVVGRSRADEHQRAADLISAGDLETGVAYFLDTVCFDPLWADGSAAYKAMTLDNAVTVPEQVRDKRLPLAAAEFSNISCPTLLMLSERSRSPFPEIIDRLQQLIPHAERALIPDASHMMSVDNFDACLAAIEQHLERAIC